jgi:1-acyl-sn-glycerol-3-phosphate acyltransferase
VPVTIESSWRLMRANFLPIPFGVRVSVRIGDPISRRPDENHAHLLEQVREEIAANLAAIRSESPVATPLRAAAR